MRISPVQTYRVETLRGGPAIWASRQSDACSALNTNSPEHRSSPLTLLELNPSEVTLCRECNFSMASLHPHSSGTHPLRTLPPALRSPRRTKLPTGMQTCTVVVTTSFPKHQTQNKTKVPGTQSLEHLNPTVKTTHFSTWGFHPSIL